MASNEDKKLEGIKNSSASLAKNKSLFQGLIALAIGTLLAICIGELFFRLTFPRWGEFHGGRLMTTIQVDGFGQLRIGQPGFDGYFAQNNGDFRVRVRINHFGLRNPQPISFANGQIWTMGDSMTFGFGVEDSETYTEQLERQLENVDVYNLAAPGNDVCGYQIMARRVPEQIRPRFVILGLFMENDVRNYDCAHRFAEQTTEGYTNENPFRFSLYVVKRYLTKNSAFYNVVAVTIKRVNFLSEVLVSIGVINREHTEPSHPNAEMTPIISQKTAKEVRHLRELFLQIPFVVMIIPARADIKGFSPYYWNLRKVLVQEIKALNLDIIDLYDALNKKGFKNVHFPHDGHWTATGHTVAAEQLHAWIKSRLNPNEP